MSAYQPYYFFNRSISYLLLKFIVKSFLSFLKVVLIAPLIFNLFQISKFSDEKIYNFFLFLPSYLIQEFAFRYGEFNGLLKIINKEKMIKVDTSCCSRFHIFDQANQLQKKVY